MIRSLLERRELLYNLITRNLKIRYKNSFFGFFWTFLNPLFMILVYTVFIGIMRFPIDLSYLIIGVIPWHFVTMCITDSINVIEGNSTLIKKTSFPRIFLPLSTMSANTVNFILSLLVVLLLIPVIKMVSTGGESYQFNLLYLAPAILLHFILVSGISLIVGVSNVYFKDTEHIIGVSLMAWFFMSPIIYPISMIQEIVINSKSVLKQMIAELYFLNPMVLILSLYRKAFLNTEIIWNRNVCFSIMICFIFFGFGIFIFKKKEMYFADEM